ncbi:hypothetical protein BGX21_003026 [Mortierella sp. AD011]|nr:hypothetical protein BGX20_004161 [Mortierella sp. AD010]KAF9403531.1 hypothetical protein BGX21_003026 [Mortierella sp. AD011]
MAFLGKIQDSNCPSSGTISKSGLVLIPRTKSVPELPPSEVMAPEDHEEKSNSRNSASKLENAEWARKKEEKRFRQATKLLRIQRLGMEPFLALISSNNARLTVLNPKAFARFCHVKEAEEEEEEEDSSSNSGLNGL